MGDARGGAEVVLQKSYFDVLGICCPSEVPLVEKILKPLAGVRKVSVVVPSKTVIVEHDPALISQLQLLKVLNQARLEATVRSYGTDNIKNKWPSPYIFACLILLVASLFQIFFRPLRWLAVGAVAVGLPPIVLRSIVAVKRCTLDINILMLIAVAGAVALMDFSEAGFIVVLFTTAEWLETMASQKATKGMSALMSMAPQKAILAETGQVVDAREVKVNTILAVKAGEVIPIDGVVVEGKSEVNEQSLTGESFPVPKQPQSLVWAGTLNIDGYISVKTTALAEDSAVAKMAKLVEEAQNNRSKTQRLIDSCAKYYTPAVVVIAAGVAVIPLILRVHNPKHWFKLALVLLVSACPCALVLSTPVATFCALLKAARIGLLIKGGDVLEALARTRVVAFDKTGTITRGEFNVMELHSIGCQTTTNTLVYWISSIESKSSHPMASALVDYARSRCVVPKPDEVTEFQIYPGEGVYGEIDGKKIYIGNKRIAARAGCHPVPNAEAEGTKEAVTLGYVLSDAELIGMFTLSDSCRTGAAEAIRELKAMGLKVAMLTGDSTAAATHAQNQLGRTIEVLHAELLPEDKVQIINNLKTKEGPTAMVGDGMNDAPALAAATVGISMGISGSAVAMETSHMTLMSNDILKIPRAIRLAKKTHNKIVVNILFSVVTKIAILALAIAGHPLLWAAVLADVGTCLIVIINSMTLLRSRTQEVRSKCSRSSHKPHGHKHKQNHGHCCSPDVHKHMHADECSSGAHKHMHADNCRADNCRPDVHKHVHTDQSSTGGHCTAHTDHCCQETEGTSTSSNQQFGAAHCTEDAHEAHTDRYMNQDQCTKKECCQPQDHIHQKQIVVTACRMDHHVRGSSDESSRANSCSDCNRNDAHSSYKAEHSSNAIELMHSGCCNVSKEETCGSVTNIEEPNHAGCCNGSKAEADGYHMHVECEVKHHLSVTHNQPTRVSSCESVTDNCNSARDTKGVHTVCRAEDHAGYTEAIDLPGCCGGSSCSSPIPAATAARQHIVVIEDEAEHDLDPSTRKGCHQSSDASITLAGEKGNSQCCRTGNKKGKEKVCSLQHSHQKREISGHHEIEMECERKTCCSSFLKEDFRRKKIGGSCQSYRYECGQKEGCCAGGIAHLPQIVIE